MSPHNAGMGDAGHNERIEIEKEWLDKLKERLGQLSRIRQICEGMDNGLGRLMENALTGRVPESPVVEDPPPFSPHLPEHVPSFDPYGGISQALENFNNNLTDAVHGPTGVTDSGIVTFPSGRMSFPSGGINIRSPSLRSPRVNVNPGGVLAIP